MFVVVGTGAGTEDDLLAFWCVAIAPAIDIGVNALPVEMIV
ncbi:MAG TPA: hypothetical protein VNE42_06940 [Acidimicrobiales bacterium]|nr:hypothetical protein [Acidimicrobiales bacterium]